MRLFHVTLNVDVFKRNFHQFRFQSLIIFSQFFYFNFRFDFFATMKTRILDIFVIFSFLPAVVLSAVLGIDFGSAFSKSVLLAPGIPFEPVLSSDSKRKDISALTFKVAHGPASSASIERIYGNAAQTLLARYPTQSFFYFKSLLGQSFDSSPSVKSYLHQFPGVELVASKNNRSSVSVNLLDENYPIEELLAMYFSDIKTRALATLKASGPSSSNSALNTVTSSITNAVINVPPGFSIFQRKAIEDAAELAEIPLSALVNDGTAVITNYASNRQFDPTTPEYHLILDVGASEVSASLFSIRGGSPDIQSVVIELEGIGYDPTFGGHALTSMIKDILVEKFIAAHGKSVSKKGLQSDFKVQRKLWIEAERTKNILSANSEVTAHIEGLYQDLDLRVKITRAEFEAHVEPMISRVTGPISEALTKTFPGSSFHLEKTTKSGENQLTSIIYMGGATRMPLIQKAVESIYGQDKISKKVNTDEAGAMGATLRAVGISKVFKSRNITILEKTPNHYDATVLTTVPSKKKGKFDVSEKKIELFNRGDLLDSVKSVNLSVPTDCSHIEIVLSENDQEFISIEASEIAAAINDKDCTSAPTIKAEFKLTLSQTIELVNLWAECDSGEEVRLVEQETEKEIEKEVKEGETQEEKEKLETVRIPKIKQNTIARKLRYRNVRPLGTATKQSSTARLKSLEKSDLERKTREALRNKIEGEIYKLKELIYEHEDATDSNTELGNDLINLDEVKEAVEGLVDWLDYEASDATNKDLKQKQDEVAALLKVFTKKPEDGKKKTKESTKSKKHDTKPENEKQESSFTSDLHQFAARLKSASELSKVQKAEYDKKVEELVTPLVKQHEEDEKNGKKEKEVYDFPLDEISTILDIIGDESDLMIEMQSTMGKCLTALQFDGTEAKDSKKKNIKLSAELIENLESSVTEFEKYQKQLKNIRDEKIAKVEKLIQEAEEIEKTNKKGFNDEL